MSSVAYDERHQRWVYGDHARQVLRAQISQEIQLLTGPGAEEYAKLMGVKTVDTMLAQLVLVAE